MKHNEMQKHHTDTQTRKKRTTCSKYIRETFSGISLKAAVKTKIHLAANVTSAHVSLPGHLQQLPVSHTQNITNEPASVAL